MADTSKWFELPAQTAGQWIGFAAGVIVVMAIAMRLPVVKRAFPR